MLASDNSEPCVLDLVNIWVPAKDLDSPLYLLLLPSAVIDYTIVLILEKTLTISETSKQSKVTLFLENPDPSLFAEKYSMLSLPSFDSDTCSIASNSTYSSRFLLSIVIMYSVELNLLNSI